MSSMLFQCTVMLLSFPLGRDAIWLLVQTSSLLSTDVNFLKFVTTGYVEYYTTSDMSPNKVAAMVHVIREASITRPASD